MAVAKFPFKMLGPVVFGLAFGLALSSHARVATAPNSADQRLINPAAAALRDTFGLAVNASRQEDQESVLGLTRSSIDIKTKIDTVNTNAAIRTGSIHWELNISPQTGTKDTVNVAQTNSGPENNNTSAKLTILPVQALTSVKIGSNISFGVKFMYTRYQFNDTTDILTNAPTTSDQVNETKDLSGNFVVAAPGVIYQFGNSGLSLAYLAEFLQVQKSQTVIGTIEHSGVEIPGVGSVESSAVDIKSNDTVNVRKDIVGLGYSHKFSGGNNFRLEGSFEKMPPLTKVQGYPFGELYRGIAETNFIFLRLGVEYTRKTGFYVDPYNLIPYFFRIDHLGVDPVEEFNFFGGLKTSAGHGFGASYSQSTSKSRQKLTVGGSEQEIEKTSTRFGLSYSYVF